MTQLRRYEGLKRLILFGTVLLYTGILLSLCFNEGLDYDEAFSYSIIQQNSLFGIPGGILNSRYSDVAPLWYMGLKLWTMIFGESIIVCKFFTVLGSVATMLLGATVIYRNWGFWTAMLYMLPAGLAPGIMHVGVNIRTYSWTVFLVTASALLSYELVKTPKKTKLWVGLFLTTISGLFCHHFTAFGYLFVYFYLFCELIRVDYKQIWKLFLSGLISVGAFTYWMIISDFFGKGGKTSVLADKMKIRQLLVFSLRTFVPKSLEMGIAVICLGVLFFILFRKRFSGQEKLFILLGFVNYVGSYLVESVVAVYCGSYRIAPRHAMHGIALLWLAMAIVLPRISKEMALFYGCFLISMCSADYSYNYDLEYKTIPYMEETKQMIADSMEPGDVVIFNVEEKFSTIYLCYMPDQKFICLKDMTEETLDALRGKRVWFFLCSREYLADEWVEKYHITKENKGHYGFQIIDNCTDFDLLKLEIAGE